MKIELTFKSAGMRTFASATLLLVGVGQTTLSYAASASDTTNVKELQEVVAGLQMLIGNVSVLAANTPSMPGFYDSDASGQVIDRRTVAGNSPANVMLGVSNVRAMAGAAIAQTGAAPAAHSEPTQKSLAVAGAAPATASKIAAVPASVTTNSATPMSTPAAKVGATVGAAVPPAQPLVVVAEQTWAIKPNSTVQETLTAWAREAGWNPPKWQAATPYRIVDGAPIKGSFFDALRTLANAVPQIDITASPDRHELVISDARK